jgi:hypothetical protein
MFNVGDYVCSSKTLALHYKTNSGTSKNSEWISADTPSIVKEVNSENILIDNFCHSQSSHYIVPIEELTYFTKCETDEGGHILGLKWYPGERILKTEFDKRKDVCDFEKNLKSTTKKLPENDMVRILLDGHVGVDGKKKGGKFGQMKAAQGAPCDTISSILNYNIEEIRKEKTKRFDNMIYNRTSRWSPPIPESHSYEEYEKSINFTRPIGTRPKDFCLPSELVDTYKEMIKQIICFKNVTPETKQKIMDFLDIDASKCVVVHKCKWSGKEIDIDEYSSTYSSKDNFIEICHRDPNDRFLSRNMYWGFGESNRQQGGYSEENRVKQIAQLVKTNPELMELLMCELKI